MATMKFPAQGQPKDDLLKNMFSFQADDVNWKEGRTSSLVYFAGEEVTKLMTDAYAMYFMTNGLSPLPFPSLKKFESEVVAMAAGLLGGDAEVVGNMTSGGTESILMAVKAARDKARAEKPQIKQPEMVTPNTVHPAFDKAANYLGLKIVKVPVNSDFVADVAGMKAAVNKNTVLMVGSSPAFPQGTIDPIPELAAFAQEKGILFHVDACLGGFLLPFVRKAGFPVKDFDFNVPGVTSISADIHKYGFGPRGTSVILYKNAEIRKYQYFIINDWPGGLYGSPTMTGSRPGAAIAAAWAVMNYLGEEGYLKFANIIMNTTKKIIDGINEIPELYVLGKPDMSVFSFASDEVDILSVGDEMAALGWSLDRQQLPTSLHMMVTPAHENVVEKLLADLKTAVKTVKEPGYQGSGMGAFYGGMFAMPERAQVDQFISGFMDSLTSL